MKICPKCHQEKILTEFYVEKSGKRKGRIHSYCKTCERSKVKLYRESNLDKCQKRDRAYHDKNRILRNENRRRHAQKNKEHCRSQSRIYALEHPEVGRRSSRKYNQKPKRKLAAALRMRVRHALHGRNKSARTLELVGCSIEHLKLWLTFYFQKDMSWENYGEWHIDHIKPCAKFDLSDPAQQRACFHYTNLQPLWAGDNIRKGDKYVAV